MLNQVFVTTLSLVSAAGLMVSESAAETVPYVLPVPDQILIAQENRLFEYEDPQFWAEQCLLISQESDPQKTLETCEQAISLRPDDPALELWQARSQALFDLGMDIESIASFNQVLAKSPQNSIALAYQCAAFNHLNRYAEAVDTCEAALRIDGNWGDRSPGFAWYHRGLALQETGRLETALASFTRAVENQPESALYQASRCAVEIDLGQAFQIQPAIEETAPINCNLLNTIALYSQALASEPDNFNLWLHQGMALEQLNNHSGASTAYQQALIVRPQSSLALSRYCAVLNQLEAYEEALAACESAFQGDNRWGRVGIAYGWTQHSRALIGLKDYEGALASARQATAIALPLADALDQQTPQTYPPAWNNLAVSLWHLEDYDQAEEAIREAKATYHEYQQNLDNSFERRYPESPIFFYRGYALASFNHGRILMSQGNPENYWQALAAYNTAYTFDPFMSIQERRRINAFLGPNNTLIDSVFASSIHTQRALALYQMDEFDDSAQVAKLATEFNPASFTAQYNLGLIALENQNYETALRAYAAANRLQPENVYVLTGQGLALTGLNRTKDALTVLEQVLNILPRYELAETTRSCIMDLIQEDARANVEAVTLGNNNADRLEQLDIKGCVPE